MIDLDRELTELGERWRAAQPEPFAHVAPAITPVRRPRRVVGLVVALLVVGAVMTIAFVASRHESTHSVRVAPHTAPPVTRPPTQPEGGVIDLSAQTSLVEALDASNGTIWAAGDPLEESDRHAPLFAVAARSSAVTQTFSLPVTYPFALRVAGNDIWVRGEGGEANQSTSLVKVDRTTGTVLGSRELGLDGGLTVTSAGVWALDGDQLLRIDPDTLDTVAVVPVPGGLYPPVFITSGTAGIWLASPYDGNVFHVNTTSNRIDATVLAGDHLSVMTELDRSLWVLDNTELVEINAESNKVVARVPLGRRARDLTTDGTVIYVAGDGPDTVQRVDPHTHQVTPMSTSRLMPSASSITYDRDTGSLWVAGGTLVARVDGA